MRNIPVNCNTTGATGLAYLFGNIEIDVEYIE
jgi:hypothetical protein